MPSGSNTLGVGIFTTIIKWQRSTIRLMISEHKSSAEILREIAEAKSKITIGATYVHYKGSDKRYTVRGLATLESTNELCVIYQTEYGDKLTFVRPLSIWLEDVEWNGKTVPRFKRLS